MAFTKSEIREAITSIYNYLEKGQSDKQIMKKMGLDAEIYNTIKTAMFDAKAKEIRSTPEEHMYIQYILDQNRNIKDLTEIIKGFDPEKKSHNAIVGAIRARSDITDKMITKAQEFGIIKKTPDRKEIVAGVVVAELSNNQLKENITEVLANLGGLVKKYGGAAGKNKFLEMPEPKNLYRGPKLPPAKLPDTLAEPPKKNATNTKSKIFKGRKKMMPPAPIKEEE